MRISDWSSDVALPIFATSRRYAGTFARDGGAPADRPYVMAAVRIAQVRSVLGEILQWEYPADASLSHWFRAHPKLGMRDRGEVAEAVLDVLRPLRRYRQYAASGTGPAARRPARQCRASVLQK